MAQQPRQHINPWWYTSALAVAWAIYQVFEFQYWQWPTNLPLDKGAGPFVRAAWLNAAVMVGVCIASFLILGCQRLDRTRSRARQWVIVPPLALFLTLHIGVWWVNQRSAWLWVEDVGKMTVAADRAVLHGINPYAAHTDPEHNDVTANNLHGYKYFPLMMAAYAPAVALVHNGDQAILLANLIFSLIAAGVLAALAWRWISPDAALFCMTLFFMSRLISEEELQRGSNDVVPMILVMLGLLVIERRLLCGFLIGLAISSKLLPGLLWVVICLTPRDWRRYFAGIALGLIPCLLFAAWDPTPFIRNAILFPLTRPREGQSIFYPMPAWVGLAAEVATCVAWLMFAVRAWRVDLLPLRRCAFAAALIVLFEFVSPNVHQNYFIWWFMPFCLSATALAFNPAIYEWIGNGRGLTTERKPT